MVLWTLFLRAITHPIGQGVVIALGLGAFFCTWLVLHDAKVSDRATAKLSSSINSEDRKDASKAAAAVAARAAAELAERARQANTAKLQPLSPLAPLPPGPVAAAIAPTPAGVRKPTNKVRRSKCEQGLFGCL